MQPGESLELDLFMARQRLNAAAEAAQDAAVELLADGTISAWNPAAETAFGYGQQQAMGQNCNILDSAQETGSLLDLCTRAANGRPTGPFEIQLQHKGGRPLPVSAMVVPVLDRQGTIVAFRASLMDLSHRKEAERQQVMLKRESTHRIKNAFAVLQSILHFTLKNSPKPADFARVFSNRLHSLSATHDLLAANNWKGIELGALARQQLAAYDRLDGTRLQVRGPEVNLPVQYATSFGLIFNELAANSEKHGAWRLPAGHVQLTWAIEATGGESSRLHLCWRERGGPPPSTHRPPGLGVVLIERSLSDARVLNTYEMLGLTCTIELEISPSADRQGNVP